MTKHRHISLLGGGRKALHHAACAAAAIIAVTGGVAACGAGSPSSVAPSATGASVSTTAAPHETTGVSASSSTRVGSTIDACAFISEQDAAAFLGTDPGPGKSTNDAGSGSTCSYASGSSRVAASIGPGTRADFDHLKAIEQRAFGPSSVQDVTGVGDAAIASPGGKFAFFKGHTMVLITTTGVLRTAATADKLSAVAKAVAARI